MSISVVTGTVVMSNRNVIIPSPDGRISVRLSRGSITPVPKWVTKTAYFKALVDDGKLILFGNTENQNQNEIQEEAEKARKAAEEAAREAAEEAARRAAEDETSETASQQEEAPVD